MRKHSVSGQFNACRCFYARGCDVCWIYNKNPSKPNNNVLSLMVKILIILHTGTWLRGDLLENVRLLLMCCAD